MIYIKNETKAGFTLIEVLIAMVIFAVGFLAIGRMQITSIQGNSTAYKFTEAISVAQYKIDLFVSLPYDHSSISSGSHPKENININNKDFSVKYTVTQDNPIPNTKKIAINVIWDDGKINRKFDTNFYKSVDF